MCITSISLNGLQMCCWLPTTFVPQLKAQFYTPDSTEALCMCVCWMPFHELISKYPVKTQFEVKDTKPLGLYSYHGFEKSGVTCIQLRKKKNQSLFALLWEIYVSFGYNKQTEIPFKQYAERSAFILLSGSWYKGKQINSCSNLCGTDPFFKEMENVQIIFSASEMSGLCHTSNGLSLF